MSKTKIAKLFENGTSQAVNLPAGFEFEGGEVFATRDDMTGDVVLSRRPGAATWRKFYKMMEFVEIPADFMVA
jgi:antitoxin VapB